MCVYNFCDFKEKKTNKIKKKKRKLCSFHCYTYFDSKLYNLGYFETNTYTREITSFFFCNILNFLNSPQMYSNLN